MANSAEKQRTGNGGRRGASRAPAVTEVPTSGSTSALVRGIQDKDSVWLSLDELHRWEENPRANDANAPNVAQAIERWGFVNPIVVWRAADRMVAGDTRLKAMRLLLAKDPQFTAKGAPGPGLVRVVFHDFVDEHEANLYALADNRLNELSDWNKAQLEEVLAKYDDEERKVAGFEREHVDVSPDLEVQNVDVEFLARETFWLTVRGPMPSQPDVLDRLRDALAKVEGVEVTFGSG